MSNQRASDRGRPSLHWRRTVFWFVLATGTLRGEGLPPVTVSLPLATVSVTGPVSASAGDQAYHVFSGGSLSLAQSGVTVLVESGGKLLVTGNANRIYLAPKAECEITGSENEVHLMVGSLLTMTPNNRRRLSGGYAITQEPPPMEAVEVVAKPLALEPQMPVAAMPTPAAPEATAVAIMPTLEPSSPEPSAPVATAPSLTPTATALAVVAEKPRRSQMAALGADPLVAKLPVISELLQLLPTPDDPVPAIGEDLPPTGMEGEWQVAALEVSNLPGGVTPETTGTVVFALDGAGSMEVKIDAMGHTIERRGWFHWRAGPDFLEINPERNRTSKWQRTSPNPNEQEASLMLNGSEVRMKLKRVDAVPALTNP